MKAYLALVCLPVKHLCRRTGAIENNDPRSGSQIARERSSKFALHLRIRSSMRDQVRADRSSHRQRVSRKNCILREVYGETGFCNEFTKTDRDLANSGPRGVVRPVFVLLDRKQEKRVTGVRRPTKSRERHQLQRAFWLKGRAWSDIPSAGSLYQRQTNHHAKWPLVTDVTINPSSADAESRLREDRILPPRASSRAYASCARNRPPSHALCRTD